MADANRGTNVSEDRLLHARDLYERAVFGGDEGVLADADAELDGVEADLALARGRVMHARFLSERRPDARELVLFERAVELYEGLGDTRGEAEAVFWVGCYHQVVEGDTAAALPALERSAALADAAGDRLTRSYAVRHLGFAELAAGRPQAARELLEESLRLRREVDFQPGVAAALLALAEAAAEAGDVKRARTLIAEAADTSVASGAYGTLRWVEAFRAELG
jgi:tetratricopeptide (TPR) repeat protein